MSRISVLNLVKRFGGTTSVDGIGFIAEEGELTTLLGPSGCGKTTTLRMIAGLELPTTGEIWLGNALVAAPAKGVHVPAEKRNIGMVFQSYAIWPHKTAFENVAYPLRARGISTNKIRDLISPIFDILRLRGLEDRYPGELSGGQQQRIALARALIYRPRILLLDEPLANLDAKVREVVRFELRQLQKELRFTAIYVTHDQNEAMALSDKIVVMNSGQIVQEGTPAEIYETPANRFVAEFVGQTNILKRRVRVRGDGELAVELDPGYLIALPHGPGSEGEEVTMCIRPENLMINSAQVAGVQGTIIAKIYLGNILYYRVAVDGGHLQVQVEPGSDPRCVEGQQICLTVRGDRIQLLT